MKLSNHRSVVNVHDVEWEPYSIQGREQVDCSWHNISYDDSGSGTFLFRFKANGTSIPHEHLGWEEFLVIEGEIEECDGSVYLAGDLVSLSPGSKHWSGSKSGAVALVFVRGGFRTLPADESVHD
jgi:anti-sigma factor ChrR (cupin superfamily)